MKPYNSHFLGFDFMNKDAGKNYMPPLVPDCPIWNAEIKKRIQEKPEETMSACERIKRFFGEKPTEISR